MNYSYKIHIINRDLNLDPTYKNVVQVFNPLTKTKDYSSVFTNDELSFDATDTEINFDLKDGINASVLLEIQSNNDLEEEQANINKQFGVNTNSVSMQEAINRQYAIVQETTTDDNGNITNTKLYFYFIDNAVIKNSFSVKYDLVLDAFMTYPLFSDIDVNKTKISRAHVDRFASGSVLNNASFNLNNNFLETGEPIEDLYQKIRKQKINAKMKNICGTNYQKISTYTPGEDVINDIILNTRWLYALARTATNNQIWIAPYYPKETTYNIKYYISHTTNYTVDGHRIDANMMYYNKAEDNKVYNGYISPFGPFGTINNNITNYRIAYSWDPIPKNLDIIFLCNYDNDYSCYYLNNSYEIENANNKIKQIPFFIADTSQFMYIDYSGIDMLFNNISYFESENIKLFDDTGISLTNNYNYTDIEKAEVKTKMRMAFNEFKIKSQFDDAETILDLNILKTTNVFFKIINNLNPSNDGDIYITLNDLWEKNFGITSKIQYTPLFYSDKFKEYQATNKNYRVTGQALPIITGTLGGAIGGALKGGAIGAGVGGVVGFGSSAYKVHANFDNMINTPDAIKLKGQNITIDEKITPSYIYLEHNELREEDLKAVNMYFYEFGYNIGIIDNIENYLTRSSFNYIQLENCKKDLHALINEKIIDIVVKALENGVRFWKPSHYTNDKFNYTTNNLETKLL